MLGYRTFADMYGNHAIYPLGSLSTDTKLGIGSHEFRWKGILKSGKGMGLEYIHEPKNLGIVPFALKILNGFEFSLYLDKKTLYQPKDTQIQGSLLHKVGVRDLNIVSHLEILTDGPIVPVDLTTKEEEEWQKFKFSHPLAKMMIQLDLAFDLK